LFRVIRAGCGREKPGGETLPATEFSLPGKPGAAAEPADAEPRCAAMDLRFFNEHTGAACGLVIGVVVGSVMLAPVRLGPLIQSLTIDASRRIAQVSAAAGVPRPNEPHQATPGPQSQHAGTTKSRGSVF
jgi:hypothetical protein